MDFDKAIVTGGAGFIGSHLVDYLIKLNKKVIVIDNMRSGREENIKHNLQSKKKLLEVIYEDIRSDSINSIFKEHKPDVVFHLAAIPGVAYSMDNIYETTNVNIGGTSNLLEASKKNGVKKFIFSSSSSVYGGSEVLPTPESTQLNPKSPYAMQKMIGEQYCKLFSDLYGIETACLRYFNVFGPRQLGSSPYAAVIAAFAESIKKKTQPIIHGDGSQFRDFCPVENVVYANILAAKTDNKLLGEVFNVGCGGAITVDELHLMMGCKTAKYTSTREGDVKCSQADISKAKNILGYSPVMSFEKGLENTLEWYLNNKD